MLTSVIIPAYNCERYLETAVESVARESASADLEIIIVEDGSTDGTLALCERLREKHPELVRVLRHPGGANLATGASRNLGIEESRGELLAFLDADDYWLPGRLDVALKILAERPEVDGVYEPVDVVFEAGSDESDVEACPERIGPGPGLESGELLKTILFDQGWHVAGIVLRKTALEKTGLFPATRRHWEDSHLWMRVAAKCNLAEGRMEEAVARYRRHGENRWKPSRDRDYFELYWDLCHWFEENVDDKSKKHWMLSRLIGSVSRFPSGGVCSETLLRAWRAFWVLWAFPRALKQGSYHRCLRRILTLHPLWQKLRARRTSR